MVLLLPNTIGVDAQPDVVDDVNSIHLTSDQTRVKYTSLRGETTGRTTAAASSSNHDDDDDNDEDDDERYILDYDQINVQHSRKLVTILDHPLPPKQEQRQQKRLFTQFRRDISNITWIVRVDSDETTDLLLSKILPNKIVYRMKLVFNGFIVKGISRSTLTSLLRRSDVLLIEEVRDLYNGFLHYIIQNSS